MVSRLCNLPNSNSYFLFGARGTGKTSLIKAHFENSKDCLYFDLLDDELLDRYSISPNLFKSEILSLDHIPKWVIVDEIQRAPKLLNIVHQLIESKHKIKFVLTGSSSRRLKQQGVNLLAGRAWIRNLYSFTFWELKEKFDLIEVINFGSLPKILEYTNAQDKTDFLKSYVHTYLNLEIKQEQWLRKLEPFRKFLPIAAQMNGAPLNYSKLAREAGTESPTVKSYFEILEDTLMGFHLSAFHESVRKQQRQAEKFYFFDLGIKRALQKTLSQKLVPQTSDWGHAFEHLVICEIYRLNEYFQSDFQLSYLLTKDDFEIDLVLSKAGKANIFIEIKSADQVFVNDFSNLAKVSKEKKAITYVLSNDPISRIEQGIHFLPWQKGIKEIFNSQ